MVFETVGYPKSDDATISVVFETVGYPKSDDATISVVFETVGYPKSDDATISVVFETVGYPKSDDAAVAESCTWDVLLAGAHTHTSIHTHTHLYSRPTIKRGRVERSLSRLCPIGAEGSSRWLPCANQCMICYLRKPCFGAK